MKSSIMTYQLKILLIVLSLFFSNIISAQTFGFGCLGLSGFYAGFTKQQYKVDGINDFINLKYLGNNKIIFKEGTGYRVGANLFRAKFEGLFFSAKGYYQFLRETHENVDNAFSNKAKDNYSLKMNYWGVAVDFGVPLISFLDFKIIEGGLHFYDVELENKYYINDVLQSEYKYEPEKTKVSYYIGSGVILHLIPDYISIEGTASYTFVKIDKFISSNGNTIPTNANGKIPFEKGGFSATVQLNVGFPL